VQELLKLTSQQAHGYVVSTEGLAEHGPRHQVAILNSDGEVSPPSTGMTTKLLDCVQSLLKLSTMHIFRQMVSIRFFNLILQPDDSVKTKSIQLRVSSLATFTLK
jgi:hypothetical protein